ncbi:MBL fold metallo-hydrolase [Rhodoblastus sp.]|uniref:MBL fold metallo-hydrolase n=1 Tax=Rhodoblastus sp. TaxID=1962975 RepID=UPI003F9D1C77
MRKNPYYRGPRSDHFDGLRFFNTPVERENGLADVLRWRFEERYRAPWPARIDRPPPDRPPERVAGASLRLSYIGHASFLLQCFGLNILVDPVWSERASPVAFAGPKRLSPAGVAFEDLPPIDAVLVTHNHYDHMDLSFLSRIARECAPKIIVPLGNDAILRAADGSLRPEARDWGETVALSSEVAVRLDPAYHWSARGMFDRRMALWASFAIGTPAGTIYFIGDTAYRDGAIFREAAMKSPDIALALLPIGAYDPSWFMRRHHVCPEEAVRIFQDLGARSAFAHHWGVFRLTDEKREEPPKRLALALERAAIPHELFVALPPGSVRRYDLAANERFWEAAP